MPNKENLNTTITVSNDIDHRLVKAPYIRIASYVTGICGDIIYVYDVRMTQPNVEYLTSKQLHSIEHLLLFGFRKYLPNYFVNTGPMGCQTGFYLILLNEGNIERITKIYEQILIDILNTTDTIPYANIKDCGQHIFHNLAEAQVVARMLLNHKEFLLEVT